VNVGAATFAELRSRLPQFSRQPFGPEGSENGYLLSVVREPVEGDDRRIPVAVVSPQYELIQHYEVLDWLAGRTARLPGSQTMSLGLESHAAAPCTTSCERLGQDYRENFESVLPHELAAPKNRMSQRPCRRSESRRFLVLAKKSGDTEAWAPGRFGFLTLVYSKSICQSSEKGA
jgi:hypothetical protein